MLCQPRDAILRPVLTLFPTFLMGLPQGIAPAAGQAQPVPTKLNILIVEGEGAINNVRQRTAREPIVQVTTTPPSNPTTISAGTPTVGGP